MSDLKPCPFCGTDDHLSFVRIGSAVNGYTPYAVRCRHLDCDEVQGPTGNGKLDARRLWNAQPVSTEISSLRSRVAELEGALEPFADLGGYVLAEAPPEATMFEVFTTCEHDVKQVSLEYFRKARAAIRSLSEGGERG